MVKEEELATFVICAPTFEVALKYRYIMSGMKNSPKFRNPEWVERCLEFGYLVSDDKPIQGMPGRAKSNPYAYSCVILFHRGIECTLAYMCMCLDTRTRWTRSASLRGTWRSSTRT